MFSGGDENFCLAWEVGEASRDGVHAILFRAALTNLTDRSVYLKELGLSSIRGEALVCAGAPVDWFLGGTQMISDPMAADASKQNLRMLEILSPPAREKAKPLQPATDPLLRSFGMSVNRPFGDSFAEMVHNPADTEESCPVTLPAFNGTVRPCHVWSFWDRRYLGVRDRDFEVFVPAHGCVLLRFTPVPQKETLTLLGSDLHISMGAAEIADIRIGGAEAEIRLNSCAGAREGTLCFICEKTPVRVTASGMENVRFLFRDRLLRATVSGCKLSCEQSILISFDKA